jgi:hypothetical protein
VTLILLPYAEKSKLWSECSCLYVFECFMCFNVPVSKHSGGQYVVELLVGRQVTVVVGSIVVQISMYYIMFR